jgi:hypothetical protein
MAVCSEADRYSRTPLIRTLVIRTANYPDRLGPSGKFVEGSTKLTSLEITGHRIKYRTVLWLLELELESGVVKRFRRGYVLHIVTAGLQTASCTVFSKKNPIIRNFCTSGWLAVPINPDKRISALQMFERNLLPFCWFLKMKAAPSARRW